MDDNNLSSNKRVSYCAPVDVETKRHLEKAYDHIECLLDRLNKLLTAPLVHATVVHANNSIDPSKFDKNDLVVFVDNSDDNGRTACIISKPNKNGIIEVMFADLRKRKVQIGINGKTPEVKLLGKNDGTNVTISHDGVPYEVHGVFGKEFLPGQAVKVHVDTKQIIDTEGLHSAGDIVIVKKIIDELNVEVDHNGSSRIVLNSKLDVKVNDRVQLDSSNIIIIRHLPQNNNNVDEEIQVGWDQIGGCEEAKEAMFELFELPFSQPEIYKFYNKKMPKGGLLYGPPGCGKTLIAKASYTSLCKRFGKNAMSSGWIYVKGPELLNMYLGNSEANIRELFRRGEDHFKKTKIPAVMFIDEAEALLPMRGSGKSSDVERTTVPMFLSEVDGLETNHTIILLATNRPEMIDPAAIRHGRCDRHIKVFRPNHSAAIDIFKIHLNNVPLADSNVKTVTNTIIDNLFSDSWILYKLKEGFKNHKFYLRDALNGAMIASIVEQATSVAIKRDLYNGKKPKGVYLDDFHEAVKKIYKGQLGQNHAFDLEDFCDINKIDKHNLLIERCYKE